MKALWLRVTRLWWIATTLLRSGMIAPLRPDKYLRMADVVRRQGSNATTGLSLAAVRRPGGTALVDERGSLTWAELERRCNALAVGLAEHTAGGKPETIGILCRNHRGFVEALSATARLGADALLLNTGFSAPQLADVLEREHAQVIVYDEEFADLLGPARERLEALVEVVAWAEEPRQGSVDWLIDDHLGQVPPKPERHGRTVLLTSGTTGTPKGARRGGGGADQLAAMLDRIPWRAEEVVVVAAPMFHAWGFGQLAVASTMTCTVVLRRRFDPEATLELVQRHRATGLAVVPVMLERIIELPDEVLDHYDTSLLRFVTASGSRMRSEALVRFLDRFGDVVHNSYNATEAGQITVAVPADLRVAPDTAGRAVRGTHLRIVDDEWRELPTGEVGRIIVRSDSQFEGYTHGGSKDFHEDYMVSGDVGRLDDDGRLFVVGRDDEMIVSGGENVYPLEVEETLNTHEAVHEAAVLGVDDEKFGQRLAAFVVLDAAGSATPDELKAHVKSHLAGYKVPRDVTLLDELPRNASGKVVKRDLLDQRDG